MKNHFLPVAFAWLFMFATAWQGCKKSDTGLPTQLCISTKHHNQPIPHATVYLKYNTDTFPGYNQQPGYFDASFKTNATAKGCMESIPEGKHWIVVTGYDSLYYPHDVRGSLPIYISLKYKPVLDTVLYVSE